jgi:formylglycine-generating enzyme required for sulfatase activity
MAESFDGYYQWLGIPPAEQPPNHYRLLGVQLFEPNDDVIVNAADQRMLLLRTFQTGKQSALSQRLLNEVAAAKVCLLNSEKRAAYDATLRAASATPSNDALPRIVPLEPRPAVTRREAGGQWLLAVAALATMAAVVFLAVKTLVGPGRQGLAPVARPAETTQEVAKNLSENRSLPLTPAPLPQGERGSRTGSKPASPTPDKPNEPLAKPATAAEHREASPVVESPKWNLTPRVVESPKPVPESPAKPGPAPESKPGPAEKVLVGRQPVPDSALLETALKAAQQAYESEYSAAKDLQARAGVARKIITQGQLARAGSAERFVLLRLARDIAIKAEDRILALAAVDELDRSFEINVLAMKGDVLRELAKGAHPVAYHHAVAQEAMRLADEAGRSGDVDAVEELLKLAVAAGGRAREKELVLQARTRLKELRTGPSKSRAPRGQAADARLLTNSVGMRMMLIPPGVLLKVRKNEAPQRVAITSAFYLGLTEVTRREYLAVTGLAPSRGRTVPGLREMSQFPVDSVTWLEAHAFCNRLSEMEHLPPYYQVEGDKIVAGGGPGYRLPTADEFRYAASGGDETRWTFPAADWDRYAWFRDNSGGVVHPVAQKAPTGFGLYDMAGNVWEYIGGSCGYRGQTARNTAEEINARQAFGTQPDRRLTDIGFRVARAAP